MVGSVSNIRCRDISGRNVISLSVKSFGFVGEFLFDRYITILIIVVNRGQMLVDRGKMSG